MSRLQPGTALHQADVGQAAGDSSHTGKHPGRACTGAGPSVWESHVGGQIPRPVGRPGSNVWAHGQELKITETGRKTRLKVGGGDKDPRLLWMDLEDGRLDDLQARGTGSH